MKTEIKTITPKMAEEYLATVVKEKQRSLRDHTVDQYAKAMSLGHWVLTHQGICFDDSGSLCDGQHRCAAIARSGVSVKMMVTTGMDERQNDLFTFDAIDRGALRGIGQQIQVRHGIKDSNRVAAAARVIAHLCLRSSTKMTVATTMRVLDRFLDEIYFVNRSLPLSVMLTGPVIGTLAFCKRAMPKELESFILRVGDGDGIKRGDPSFALRAVLLQGSPGNGFLASNEKACATACMHHVLGNKLTLIKSTMIGIDFFSDKQPRIVDEISSMFA